MLRILTVLAGLLGCLSSPAPAPAAEAEAGFVASGTLPAAEAFQAAAADERSVYAINNTSVARYDRTSGERTAVSTGAARHLNSGFLHEGRLYCAHSNYPQRPEKSELKVLDLETMELTTFHDFGESPHGSLTWGVVEDGHWWCNFARYGDENDQTRLVRYDEQWRETGAWTYPSEVVADLGRYSVSGGVWRGGTLLVTGHDKQTLYRLRLPAEGDVLEYIDAVPAPFTGQGIAHDAATGGLVGINRARRQVVFARPADEKDEPRRAGGVRSSADLRGPGSAAG